MNNSHKAPAPSPNLELLKDRLQPLLANCLDSQRTQIQTLATELGTDVLSCAAALLYLALPPTPAIILVEPINTIKMVRYRLDVGSEHQISEETLKKVLVEESGVDKNNINNINIRGLYTLIDLPDSMPSDIFQHLKTVEINQRPLAIKRVKSRFKKRSNLHRRRNKPRNPKSGINPSEQHAD